MLFVSPSYLCAGTISACADGNSHATEEALMGVWAGVLFQTESPYDSMLIVPFNSPEVAHLYKNGLKKSYPLTTKGTSLEFKGTGGLRFDASLFDDNSSLLGIITPEVRVRLS